MKNSIKQQKTIPFNQFSSVGKELEYVNQVINSGNISGNGIFTKKCQQFFESRYGFKKTLLTSSCTDALEMAAILCNIKPGDEVIMPSYTFVSTANAFLLRGAKIIFADSEENFPNIDANKIEELITKRTRVIVPMHYGGIACNMDIILSLADKHNLLVVEDAAQAIDSFSNKKPLGSFGHFSAFSFHVTKNLTCGEGGMLAINDEKFFNRAEVVWEKGTNRSAFFRSEVDKYGWVDIGSSFLSSDILAAFLYAQLEALNKIQQKRKMIWKYYCDLLTPLHVANKIQLPSTPFYATDNGHLFFLVCSNLTIRTSLINFLKQKGVHAVFHYQSLHNSPYYQSMHDGRQLPNSDRYSDCLLRLPLYFGLSIEQAKYVVESIYDFFGQKINCQ